VEKENAGFLARFTAYITLMNALNTVANVAGFTVYDAGVTATATNTATPVTVTNVVTSEESSRKPKPVSKSKPSPKSKPGKSQKRQHSDDDAFTQYLQNIRSGPEEASGGKKRKKDKQDKKDKPLGDRNVWLAVVKFVISFRQEENKYWCDRNCDSFDQFVTNAKNPSASEKQHRNQFEFSCLQKLAGAAKTDNPVFFSSTMAPTIKEYTDLPTKEARKTNMELIFGAFIPVFKFPTVDQTVPDGLVELADDFFNPAAKVKTEAGPAPEVHTIHNRDLYDD